MFKCMHCDREFTLKAAIENHVCEAIKRPPEPLEEMKEWVKDRLRECDTEEIEAYTAALKKIVELEQI